MLDMDQPNKQSGFTLIEMIVSLGVFSVVVTIAVGALLILVASNRQLQTEQSVLSNLGFAIDSMTREIRTGTYYYCMSNDAPGLGATAYDQDSLNFNTNDCPDGNDSDHQTQGVSFVEGGDSLTGGASRIMYYFNSVDGNLYRRIGAAAPESIVGDAVDIRQAEFYVTGSEPLSDSGESRQPAVTIVIEAAESSDTSAKIHTIQTTVTQRAIDI